MNGTELAARAALPPNSKRYCGKPGFANSLKRYLASPSWKRSSKLRAELKKFIAHYSYLRLIADAAGLEPFDLRVAEALWIGNGLLRRVKKEKLRRLIEDEFSGEGMLPKAKARKLASSLPDGFLPHHSFHVLYLHTISGVIAPSIKNADSCRISWGKVVRVGEGSADVLSQRLCSIRGKLAIVPAKKRIRLSCAGMRLVPDLKEGDTVASHWGTAVMKISGRQSARLEKYTLENIAAANRMRKWRF